MQTFFDVRASHFPWKCYSLAKKRNIFIGFSTHFHIHGSTLTRGASARERPNSCTQSSQFARSSASYANLKFPLFFLSFADTLCFFPPTKISNSAEQTRCAGGEGEGEKIETQQNVRAALARLFADLELFPTIWIFFSHSPSLTVEYSVMSGDGESQSSSRVVAREKWHRHWW